ncbi:hypothetical protein H920_01331 [Fukomys damarensis]|uniref:Uncharacterized protein n=1 Tax=Fukomys damarensis TaxID=885580 RepID=A0A091E3Z5_FUKDA|nr:hypothetical protein H920_01331 [Fukomys damarensis]
MSGSADTASCPPVDTVCCPSLDQFREQRRTRRTRPETEGRRTASQGGNSVQVYFILERNSNRNSNFRVLGELCSISKSVHTEHTPGRHLTTLTRVEEPAWPSPAVSRGSVASPQDSGRDRNCNGALLQETLTSPALRLPSGCSDPVVIRPP